VASLAKTFPWLASVLASKTEREVDSGRSSLALSKRLDRDWWLLKMSEDYLAQQPTAMWNPVRGVWERPTENLLCEHWELFSETWPISGMTRDGQVFELPMLVHLMPGSEFLSLPTPTTRDHKDGQAEHQRDGIVQTDTVARAIFNSGEVLLPTTRTSMANGPTRKEIEAGNPKTRIETEVMLGDISWGKFEPAIRRWENILGRPAPAPTKPDGKEGAHRLSSKFTEWMMGLPDGWITDCGLTRNEELKACGNGVVPQQAELALRHLLEGIPLPTGGGASEPANANG
jgi:hypothetical protein